jgi:hypothetical protein
MLATWQEWGRPGDFTDNVAIMHLEGWTGLCKGTGVGGGGGLERTGQ